MLEASQENTRYKSAIKENAKFLSKAPPDPVLDLHDLRECLSLLAEPGPGVAPPASRWQEYSQGAQRSAILKSGLHRQRSAYPETLQSRKSRKPFQNFGSSIEKYLRKSSEPPQRSHTILDMCTFIS